MPWQSRVELARALAAVSSQRPSCSRPSLASASFDRDSHVPAVWGIEHPAQQRQLVRSSPSRALSPPRSTLPSARADPRPSSTASRRLVARTRPPLAASTRRTMPRCASLPLSPPPPPSPPPPSTLSNDALTPELPLSPAATAQAQASRLALDRSRHRRRHHHPRCRPRRRPRLARRQRQRQLEEQRRPGRRSPDRQRRRQCCHSHQGLGQPRHRPHRASSSLSPSRARPSPRPPG